MADTLTNSQVFGVDTSLTPTHKTDITSLLNLNNSSSSNLTQFPSRVYSNFVGNSNHTTLSFLNNIVDNDINQFLQYVMTYFNSQLFNFFNPDINGFTLGFFIMPPFLSLDRTKIDVNWLYDVQKLITFASIDYTPPQRQVESERAKARVGGIPYATEISPTDQLSVTYIDNSNLDIYAFHCRWVDYMKDLLEGFTKPDSSYLDYSQPDMYGALDYAGSFYILKCDPSMSCIKYVGKATGIFPLGLPNKEIFGQRTTNEITTYPMSYACTYYEETLDPSHIIWRELQSFITFFAESIIL